MRQLDSDDVIETKGISKVCSYVPYDGLVPKFLLYSEEPMLQVYQDW